MPTENDKIVEASSITLFYNTKQKLRNIGRTIDALLDADFPLESGKRALLRLKDVFGRFDDKLERAQNLKDAKLIREIANNTNGKIYLSLPILGFIIRSTNVRNAFEVLEPLQNIADRALQGRPELLLSSEWDYVPFAYPQTLEDLNSFVLIGMPASEAGSALLVPLAGHELGHAVWRNRGIEGRVHTTLQQKLVTLYDGAKASGELKRHFPKYDEDDLVYKEMLRESIGESVELAVFQAEEIFCDLFAYALFGEGYVHAFSYILAPSSGTERRFRYPTYEKRLSSIRKVATTEGITLPENKDLGLSPVGASTVRRDGFVLKAAEQSLSDITDALWGDISKIIADGKIRRPAVEAVAAHLHEIRNGIPTHAPACIGDIVNAGWRYYQELQKASLSVEEVAEKVDTLNEILLKSTEVLEFRKRTSVS